MLSGEKKYYLCVMDERVIILDFGSQYTQLIARRVRELNIRSEVYPYNKYPIEYQDKIKAVILSGSPFSVLEQDALPVDLEPFLGKKPVLGICYGAQYLAHTLGGQVKRSEKREYGKANLASFALSDDPFVKNVESDSQVWMSHGDTIFELPDTFEVVASTKDVHVAAYKAKEASYDAPVYGIQFHPEVTHSIHGKQMLENFLINIADCERNWTASSFIESTVAEIKQKVGNDEVLMALSGGVDSTVAAMLIHKAIGSQLSCFFVDNGLLRKHEYEEVLASYQDMQLKIKGVDAKKEFYDALSGVADPEGKRKAIGKTFIDVFDEVSKDNAQVKWLGQGTIYPDVIESISVSGPAVTIKSHHNVGGLPDYMKLDLVEPLRMLFKDEVRRVGRELGIKSSIIDRHPFPGPGLGIRILGEVTPEKVDILQSADRIYIDKLKSSGWYNKIWQAGAVLLPVFSVGVMGDERSYEQVVALRAVNSSDGMTAEWSKIPYELLAEISTEIINNVKGINRVVYDISTKPPSTIEWE